MSNRFVLVSGVSRSGAFVERVRAEEVFSVSSLALGGSFLVLAYAEELREPYIVAIVDSVDGPDEREARFTLARQLAACGRLPEARQAFERALQSPLLAVDDERPTELVNGAIMLWCKRIDYKSWLVLAHAQDSAQPYVVWTMVSKNGKGVCSHGIYSDTYHEAEQVFIEQMKRRGLSWSEL